MNDLGVSVALDLSVVRDRDGREYHDRSTGEQEGYADDYWLFDDFDYGAVRLWQVRFHNNYSALRQKHEHLNRRLRLKYWQLNVALAFSSGIQNIHNATRLLRRSRPDFPSDGRLYLSLIHI